MVEERAQRALVPEEARNEPSRRSRNHPPAAVVVSRQAPGRPPQPPVVEERAVSKGSKPPTPQGWRSSRTPKSCSHVVPSSWDCSHRPSTDLPSSAIVPVKRCAKPSGEKSGSVRSSVHSDSAQGHPVETGDATAVEVVLTELVRGVVVLEDRQAPGERRGERRSLEEVALVQRPLEGHRADRVAVAGDPLGPCADQDVEEPQGGRALVAAHEPSAAETTSRAAACTSARWSGPRKDSA